MSKKKKGQVQRKFFIFWRVAIVVPFILGVAGYLKAGLPLIKAIYGSFCFYFVSVYSTLSNPLLDIARWTAPLFLFTGILWSLRGLLSTFKNLYISTDKNATVIYHDEAMAENAIMLSEDIKKSFTEVFKVGKPGRFYSDVPNQIVMFDSDFDNLQFLSEHKKELKGKNVYVHLKEIDSSVLDSSDYIFFNQTETVAALFWHRYPLHRLMKKGKKELDIVIIGDGEIAEKIIVLAVFSNIYRLDQKIRYHIYGNQKAFMHLTEDKSMMNDDELIFHDNDFREDFELIRNSDRVIYAADDYDGIESLIHSCPAVPIFFYSDQNTDITQFFLSKNVKSFGSSDSIYRARNIVGDRLFALARQLSFLTMTMEMSEEEKNNIKDEEEFKKDAWKKLNGFIQSSYKACVDFHLEYARSGFVKDIDEESLDTAARIEHIRWCRYYFLNGWTKGEHSGEYHYDTTNQIDTELIPFDELPEESKKRKTEIVDFLLKIGLGKIKFF